MTGRQHTGVPEEVLIRMRDHAQERLKDWNRLVVDARDRLDQAESVASGWAEDLADLKAELDRRSRG